MATIAEPSVTAGKKSSVETNEEKRTVRTMYLELALVGVGIVSVMLFLVDFVSRDLHNSRHSTLSWALYGLGSILGPVLYGFAIDRVGAINTLRGVLALESVATFRLMFTNGTTEMAALSVVLGTFISGIIPLVHGWIREIFPNDVNEQNAVWSRSSVIYASAQAISGYVFAAILGRNHGNHRQLFAMSAVAILAALVINLLQAYFHVEGWWSSALNMIDRNNGDLSHSNRKDHYLG